MNLYTESGIPLYTDRYASPVGSILLAADMRGVCGSWFEGQRFFPAGLEGSTAPCIHLDAAKRWLDIYFDGKNPDFTVPLHMLGTPFQKAVWHILLSIPRGNTLSYGEIAGRLSPNMSAQAVGNAVGRNKISVFIPCHRVLGADGSLTGYAAGLAIKEYLLALEQNNGHPAPQKQLPGKTF